MVGAAQPLAGEVHRVEPSVSSTTRLERVRITVDNSSLVRTGMFAQATIFLREADALSLPVSAVSDTGDGASVLDFFSPAECANYFAAAGYDPD